MSIIDTYIRYYNSYKKISFEQRIFYSFLSLSAIVIIFSLINNYLIGIEGVVNYIHFFILLGTFFTLYTSLNDKISIHFLKITYLLLVFIFLSWIWFLSGGIEGSANIFFYLLLAMVFSLFHRKNHFFSFFVFYLAYIVLLLIGYFYPETITSYENQEQKTIDLLVSNIMAFLILGLLLSLLKSEYDIEQERLEKQNAILHQQQMLIEEQKRHLQAQNEQIEAKNEQIQLQNIHLQEVLKKQREQLYIVNHDLKSPISSIVNILELLEAEENKEYRQNYSEMLFNLANISTTLIDQIIETALVENGATCLCIQQNISYTDIIQSVLEQELPKAYTKNQEVVLEIQEKVYANLDPDKVRAITANLVNNAIKYSPPFGKIYISLQQETDFTVFKVKDEGQGITEADKKDIFNKFSKLSAKPTGGERSHGLGLYITKKFTEIHHGKIEVESEGKNKGACFTVKIPNNIR
jgi:signal transduction histidine kinase